MVERPGIFLVQSGAELRSWRWLKTELVELANARRVATNGTKRTLIDRLAAHLDGQPDPTLPGGRRSPNRQREQPPAREGRLSFRFADLNDVPAIVGLVESAYRGEASREGWTTEADLLRGQRTDEAMVADGLRRREARMLLAESAGELVGCCELTEPGGERDTQASGEAGDGSTTAADAPHGSSPASAPAGAAYLGMFAVRPNRQGAGIGRAVLDEAARIARDDWGADTLELTTIRQREDLIAWYERRGFHRTGEVRPFPYDEPRYGLPQRDDLAQAVLARAL